MRTSANGRKRPQGAPHGNAGKVTDGAADGQSDRAVYGGTAMLVVTRKRNQSIMIRDDVEVKILGIRENQVKIGILAPKEVPVHRREVYERIQRGEPPRRHYPEAGEVLDGNKNGHIEEEPTDPTEEVNGNV